MVKHVVKEPFLTRRGIRCRRLSRRALFRVQVWGIVPLQRPRSKRFFSSQVYQFLTRLYKEYSLEEAPQLFLTRLQLDLVMGEWIAGQKIQ